MNLILHHFSSTLIPTISKNAANFLFSCKLRCFWLYKCYLAIIRIIVCCIHKHCTKIFYSQNYKNITFTVYSKWKIVLDNIKIGTYWYKYLYRISLFNSRYRFFPRVPLVIVLLFWFLHNVCKYLSIYNKITDIVTFDFLRP